MKKTLFLSIVWLNACAVTETPETGQTDDGQVTDTDPWPDDGSAWSQWVSIVSDGNVLAPGDVLQQTTAPAGMDVSSAFVLTLTNRSDQTLTLSDNPDDWLQAEGFTWIAPPPTSLEPEASAALSIAFNPSFATQAERYAATLRVPHTEASLTLTLEADVPRPLRMVLAGHHGYTLISDSYGTSFEQETFPTDTNGTEVTLGVVWGDGTFVRYGREDGWSSDAVYEYSVDGLSWHVATVAPGDWGFDCVYAFDAFLCARGAGYLTHSEWGNLFIHETIYRVGTFIQGLVKTETNVIGVGRGGTVAISMDPFGFQSHTSQSSYGDYQDVAYGQGVTVAVGGDAGYTISTSLDDGLNWTHQQWNGVNSWERMNRVVWENGLWLTQGTSNTLPSMLRSSNGQDWESLTDLGMTTSYTLLGGLNGWIFGLQGDGLFRTQDGLTWEQVHTFTTADRPNGFAAEAWEAP